MQDHASLPQHEQMPQPIGKESSHSLKYILILAFFLAWTGLVGFVGYQLKVVVDYIDGPDTEEVDEVDEDEEVEDSTVIEEDGNAVSVEYDYEKYLVSTELEPFTDLRDEHGRKHCYYFSEQGETLDERLLRPDGDVLQYIQSDRTLEELDAMKGSEDWSHFCENGDLDFIVKDSDGATQFIFIDAIRDGIFLEFDDAPIAQSIIGLMTIESVQYLTIEFGDAGVRAWDVYSMETVYDSVGMFPPDSYEQAELIESCTSRDSSDMEGYAILECDPYSGLETEELNSEE